MRRLWIVLIASPLLCQDAPPIAILRGELLRWDPRGRFHLVERNLDVQRCVFDQETYITDRRSRLAADDVRVGMMAEAVVERDGLGSCQAVTIYLLGRRHSTPFTAYRQALERQRHVLDHIAPRGNLAIAGVVLEHNDSQFVVRTRSKDRRVIRLRDDTRFTNDGRATDESMLEVHARVFVQAGEGLDSRLEAYHVVRGRILMPR